MSHNAATAYACVAYRIMEYEGSEKSEEYLDILLDILYSFYTENEIFNYFNTLNKDTSHYNNSNDICTPMGCVKEMIDEVALIDAKM